MNGRMAMILVTCGAAALTLATIEGSSPRYIWNALESVPPGLYRLQAVQQLTVPELVAIRPPEPLAHFVDLNGYLRLGVQMLKRVLALPGQTVCRTGPTLPSTTSRLGRRASATAAGELLPVWQGCRAVTTDELFVMNWQSDD